MSRHDAAEIAARHVAGDDDPALDVFAKHHVGSLFAADVRQHAYRHDRTARRVHRQIGDTLEVRSGGGIELHGQIERRAAIEDPADGRAGQARLDGLGDVFRAQAVARDHRAIQHEPHERDVHLLFERQVHDARHRRHGGADPLAEPPQRAQIVAEHLDGDIGARARQHVVDAVRDRLPDRHVRARAASRTGGAARPAAPRAAGPSAAGPRRFPRPRRPGRARRTPRGRSGAPSRPLPAATAESLRRGGRFRRTSPATFRAACWPAPSGCPRGSRAGTPCRLV